MKKKIISTLLFIVSIVLIIFFIISIRLDWLNHYEHINTSYYKCVLINGLELLLPSLISFITGLIILKNQNNDKKVKIIVIFIIVLFLLLLGILSFKSNDVLTSKDDYPVYQTVQIDKEKYDKIIKDNILDSVGSTYYEDGKYFVEYKVFSIEDIGNDYYYVYTWIIEWEYFYKDGILREGSGSSYPCRFKLKNNSGTFTIISKDIPRDGSYYIKDIEEYFPKYVRDQIYDINDNKIIQEISNNLDAQVKEYYKIK